MDPAALAPSEELLEFRRAVASRLQQLVSSLLWLLDSLHRLALHFLLNTLNLPVPAATVYLPGWVEDIRPSSPDVLLPGPSEPSPRRKPWPCRQRTDGFWDFRAAGCGE